MNAFDMQALIATSQRLQAYQPIFLGVIATLIVVALVVRRWHGQPTSHGSARFATLREARRGHLLHSRGFVMGRLNGQTLKVRRRHVLLCAPTGSQKDRSHLLESTAKSPDSLFIIDIKDQGENFSVVGDLRARRGPVYRIAPGLPGSHSLNLLRAMVRVGEPQEFRDVMVLARTLLAPMKKDQGSTESGSFFERRGTVALRGVFLYVLHSLPTPDQTLNVAHQLMADPVMFLGALTTHPHPEVRRRGVALQTLQEKSERQFAAEWSTAEDALDLFSDPVLADCTGVSDFAIADLQCAKDPMTLYFSCETTTDLLHLAPLCRCLIQTLYRQLTIIPKHQKRYDLYMLLNEFGELGWMDILERAPSHSRSARIWFWLVLQDLAQLFGTYGFQTPLWGNLGVKLFHRPDDDETALRLSRMLGNETIQVTSTTSGGRRTRNTQPTGRPLLRLEDVLGLDSEAVLAWAGLAHPLLLEKAPYWKGGNDG